MFAVRAAHAFDGNTWLPGGATVLVVDGRIAGVEPARYDVPAGVDVLDHGDATLLPGLIDTHVHLVGDSGPGALDRVAGYSEDELDAVVLTALRQQLASGVTSVRDLGDRGFTVVRHRDAQRRIDDGLPHLLASGPPITSVGGHCSSFGTAVSDRAGILAAVQQRAALGVDVVKVMAGGGVMTAGTDVFGLQFTPNELRLLADAAHRAGLPVVVHAHAATAIELALAVGADALEHASYLTPAADGVPQEVAALTSFGASDADLERLASRGIPVGPTLGGLRQQTSGTTPPAVRELLAASGVTMEQVVELRLALIRRMHESGVRLVGGMDAGIAPSRAHGAYAESVLDMSGAMPDTSALAASTSVAAEALGLGHRKGRLARGLDADLLVVDGDLASEIGRLREVRRVVVRGRVVDPTGVG